MMRSRSLKSFTHPRSYPTIYNRIIIAAVECVIPGLDLGSKAVGKEFVMLVLCAPHRWPSRVILYRYCVSPESPTLAISVLMHLPTVQWAKRRIKDWPRRLRSAGEPASKGSKKPRRPRGVKISTQKIQEEGAWHTAAALSCHF
jgi:hypothetical protein